MAYNFLRGDRDQPFLLPPDLRDWLPNDHLAWFVLDAIDQLELEPFLRTYRADGHGHPAYDPKTLLGVLLYAYAIGVRSSRQVERRCTEDLAFRALAGNQLPDHVTIARFRVRHQQALAELLVQSLKLCAAAGLTKEAQTMSRVARALLPGAMSGTGTAPGGTGLSRPVRRMAAVLTALLSLTLLTAGAAQAAPPQVDHDQEFNFSGGTDLNVCGDLAMFQYDVEGRITTVVHVPEEVFHFHETWVGTYRHLPGPRTRRVEGNRAARHQRPGDAGRHRRGHRHLQRPRGPGPHPGDLQARHRTRRHRPGGAPTFTVVGCP
jgi:transposase